MLDNVERLLTSFQDTAKEYEPPAFPFCIAPCGAVHSISMRPTKRDCDRVDQRVPIVSIKAVISINIPPDEECEYRSVGMASATAAEAVRSSSLQALFER